MTRFGSAFVDISGDFGPLRRQLAQFRDRELEINVTLDRASVAKVKAATAGLGGRETFEVKTDVDIAGLIKTRAAQALLTKESGRLRDVLDRSKLSYGQLLTVFTAGLPVIFDAAAALGALTASAAAAAAGIGALATGLGGVLATGFGGIAAIAAPAIGSLKELMTAQEAADKAMVTGAASTARAAEASAQQIRSAREQVAAATRAVTDAEEQLEVAQESAIQAQEALTDARRDATRQLQDMRRAAIEGETSENRARIALQQAQQNLRDLIREGTASNLDISDAELAVVEARQSLRDTTIDSGRAQEDFNRAQREGIKGMPQVEAAQQSLDDALRGVEDAQQGVSDAHREVAQALQDLNFQQKQANAATAAGGTSLAALALAQKEAGPAVVRFARNLQNLKDRWKELTEAGRANFFNLLNDGLDRLNRRLPLFARSATESMGALREGFGDFLDRATGPEFDKFINVMTRTFARSIGPISKGFGNIAKVLQRIAVAVSPDLVRIAESFEGTTKGWVESTKNAGKLREIIHGLVRQTEAWWDLIKAAGDLIVAVLVPGMGQGRKAVEGITNQLKEWTGWVKAHPNEMREFFKEGLETTKQLAQALLSFLPTLVEISTAMRPIARAFLALVKGLNSLKIGSVSALTVLLGAIVATKLSKGIVGMVGAFNRLKTAALGAAAAEKVAMLAPGKGAVPAPTTVAQAPFGAPMPVAPISKGALNTASLVKYAKVAGGVGVAITAVAGAFESLRTNFLGVRDVFTGFFEKVLRPLGDEFSNLVDELSGGHSAEVFSAIGAALGTIRKPAQWIVENLTKLLGIAALGAIFTGLGLAIATIVLPLRLAIKGFTLLIKGLKRLGDAVKDIAKFIAKAWIEPGVLIAPFRIGVKAALDIFRPMRGKVGSIAKDIGRTLRDVFGSAWNAVKDVFNKGAQAIGGIFGRVGARIQRIAKGVRSVFTGLAKIIHKVADFIVHAVDRMVGALGSIKDKIGDIVPSLPSLPDIPIVNERQRGGPIPGTGDGDRVKALLEPGEFVVNKKAVERHRPLIEAINQSPARFARGGWVGDSPAGLNPAVKSIAQWAMNRFGASASDTVAPRAGSSFHPSGGAVDLVSGNMLKMARGLVSAFMPKLEELIYTPLGYSISSGQRVPAYAQAEHYDHVHIAALGKAVKGAAGVFEKIKRLKIEGKGPIKDIAQGAADTMRKAANQYLGKIAPRGGDSATVAVGKGTLSRREMRRLLRANDLPDIMGWVAGAESLWNPRAHNVSGASGLWQIMMPLHQGIVSGNVFDPNVNARAAATLYRESRLVPWAESQFKGAIPGGWSTKVGVPFQKGGVVAPYVGAFKDGGPVMETGLGMLHEGEHVIPKMAEGGFAKGQHRLRIAQRIHGRLTDTLRRIPLVDELIDVAQRLAGLTTSPGGSELSKGEVAKQVRLQTQLLRMLRNAFKLTKRGLNMATAPRRNEFDSAVLNRLKALGGLFRQSSAELVGLTGTSGRIFDTKLAIRELKATVPAGAEGLRIAELVEFAEAMKFGAFKRQNVAGMPAFAQGGVVPGRPGQAVPILAHAGETVVPRGSPDVNLEARIFIGNREITDIVRLEVNEKDRRSASRYRAGVMRP